MVSTNPESIKEQASNTFRNTMEKFKSLSMDPNVRKLQREKSNDLKPHFIKVLPPNTPQKFKKIRKEMTTTNKL